MPLKKAEEQEIVIEPTLETGVSNVDDPEHKITHFQDMGKFLVELKAFLQEHMTAGVDYGLIMNQKSGKPISDKPTLFKPGAEKLLNFFSYAASFSVEDKHEDHEGGYFFYKYKCVVTDRTGRFIGDGFGSANSKEKKFTSSYATPFDNMNTIDKMAQKRALIQATLLATRASEFYTQDIEDMDALITAQTAQQGGESPANDKVPTSQAKDLGFADGEVREGTIGIKSKKIVEAKSGTMYAVLDTNIGELKAWKNTYPRLEEGKFYLVDIEASEYKGKLGLAITRIKSEVQPGQPDKTSTVDGQGMQQPTSEEEINIEDIPWDDEPTNE